MARLFLALILFFAAVPAVLAKDCVVLLHGLSRTQNSMLVMQLALERAGAFVSGPSLITASCPPGA